MKLLWMKFVCPNTNHSSDSVLIFRMKNWIYACFVQGSFVIDAYCIGIDLTVVLKILQFFTIILYRKIRYFGEVFYIHV